MVGRIVGRKIGIIRNWNVVRRILVFFIDRYNYLSFKLFFFLCEIIFQKNFLGEEIWNRFIYI